jgi:hypothetical protein
MKGSKQTQADMILQHLKQGYSLTPYEALVKFGCLRLGARIYDLKEEGHAIESVMIATESGKHVAQYSMQQCP